MIQQPNQEFEHVFYYQGHKVKLSFSFCNHILNAHGTFAKLYAHNAYDVS